MEEVAPIVPPWQVSFVRDGTPDFDDKALLKIMLGPWKLVFSSVLGQTEMNVVYELRDVRNRSAHQKPFSTDDAYRAVDSIQRLLTAIHAQEAEGVSRQKRELLQILSNEQHRRDRSGAPRADRPDSPLGRARDAGLNIGIHEAWVAIRGLEGKTLLTVSQQLPFDVVQVTDYAVVVEPHSTHRQRRVARTDFEDAISKKLRSNELGPTDLQETNTPTRNASYVVAILRALEAAG